MEGNMQRIQVPTNEPVLEYRPGSKEREKIKETLKKMQGETVEIPMFIGREEVRSGDIGEDVMPHNFRHVLARYHKAQERHIKMACAKALEAKKDWENTTFEERARIFSKAADLLAGEWRYILNAATMLSQSKTIHQAEIDSACELIDFFRFNLYFLSEIYSIQPISPKGVKNTMEYRPLEGFVFAVTPFNFTSIAGNLPTAPAIAGNTVIWKPASSAMLAAYYIMRLLKEAGLPDGVINMVPGSGGSVGDIVLVDENLAGVHFTGSTGVFRKMWRTIGENISRYKTYPRLVGETGGKDFVVAHPSADIDELATALTRGAFEYQGQKCSAASRAYIPQGMWERLKARLEEDLSKIKVGDISDFTNFMGAVIDKAAFDKITSYIEFAKASSEAKIIFGGGYSDEVGYFIEPTVILTTNPHFKTMEEEIFGPVLTIYLYEDNKYSEVLELCDKTSIYALTGSIFAHDKKAIQEALAKLRHAAGNFYINDKPTGAIVGQQPFGGSRASGTNDKAGSMFNLIRWVSIRTIKETFAPPTDFRYPFMSAE